MYAPPGPTRSPTGSTILLIATVTLLVQKAQPLLIWPARPLPLIISPTMVVSHDQLNAKLVLLLDDDSVNNSNNYNSNNYNSNNYNNNNTTTSGQNNVMEGEGVDISGIGPGGSPDNDNDPSVLNHKGEL